MLELDDSNIMCAVRVWCDAEFGELEDVTGYDDDGSNVLQSENIAQLCQGTDIVYDNSSKANTWDTSKVTTMAELFTVHPNCNLGINGWRTDAVTDMNHMFSNPRGSFKYHTSAANRAFNQNIDGWRTDAVTSMSGMFKSMQDFNQPLDSWQTAVVASTENMFDGAGAFNQPLDSWQMGAVVTMKAMFAGALGFNQKINSWQTDLATNFDFMFSNGHATCTGIATCGN